ncbi:putative glutaredoxin-like, plant II, Thioredoxin-like superfamily [Helianthus anomalus]
MATITRVVVEKPVVYELDEYTNGQQLEREMNALGCKPSVPVVFIRQDLLGGSNELAVFINRQNRPNIKI